MSIPKNILRYGNYFHVKHVPLRELIVILARLYGVYTQRFNHAHHRMGQAFLPN
jgi:hypothetical protein